MSVAPSGMSPLFAFLICHFCSSTLVMYGDTLTDNGHVRIPSKTPRRQVLEERRAVERGSG